MIDFRSLWHFLLNEFEMTDRDRKIDNTLKLTEIAEIS